MGLGIGIGLGLGGGGGAGGLARPRYDTATKTASGKAPPNATVTVAVNGATSGTATANAQGAWSYVFGTAPTAGQIITATANVTSSGYAVPGSAAARLPSNRKVYALGDSRTLDNYRSNYETMVGPVVWAKHRAKGRMDYNRSRNNGVGGATAAEIRANQFPAALASDADTLVLWAGVNSANTNALPADVIADIKYMQDTFTASSPTRCCVTFDEVPVSGLSSPATQIAVRDAIRTWEKPSEGKYVLNSWNLIATAPDGETPQTWAYRDGIHPGKRFGNTVGKALWDKLDALLPAYDIFARPGIIQGGDFVPNGNLPNGWVAPTGTGITTSMEVVDGLNWWVINIANVTSLNVSAYISATAIPSAFTPLGQVDVDALIRYKLDAGSQNFSYIRMESRKNSGQSINDNAGFTAYSGADMGSTFEAACGEIGPVAVDGLLYPPPIDLPPFSNDGTTPTTQFRAWWITLRGLPGQVANGTVRLALPQARVAS